MKLAAGVGKYLFYASREGGLHQRREASGMMAVVRCRGDGYRETAGVVGGREQVAAGAAGKAHLVSGWAFVPMIAFRFD